MSDYFRKEIEEAVKAIDAGESNSLTEEILNSIPNRKEAIDKPTQITSKQIKELTPVMTREDVLVLLGDTQDIGSGIYVYVYEVDQQYLLQIPFANDEAQLGVTGKDLPSSTMTVYAPQFIGGKVNISKFLLRHQMFSILNFHF